MPLEMYIGANFQASLNGALTRPTAIGPKAICLETEACGIQAPFEGGMVFRERLTSMRADGSVPRRGVMVAQTYRVEGVSRVRRDGKDTPAHSPSMAMLGPRRKRPVDVDSGCGVRQFVVHAHMLKWQI